MQLPRKLPRHGSVEDSMKNSTLPWKLPSLLPKLPHFHGTFRCDGRFHGSDGRFHGSFHDLPSKTQKVKVAPVLGPSQCCLTSIKPMGYNCTEPGKGRTYLSIIPRCTSSLDWNSYCAPCSETSAFYRPFRYVLCHRACLPQHNRGGGAARWFAQGLVRPASAKSCSNPSKRRHVVFYH